MTISYDARSLAYWEWLRAANPWLPPFYRLSTASFDLNVSTRDLEMKVVLDWPSEPFRFDPWEEALETTPKPASSEWDYLLDNAIRNISACFEEAERYPGSDRRAALMAAAKVRAMAPDGTKWDEPWPINNESGMQRHYLRATIRWLLAADEHRSKADGTTSTSLSRAESYLHGLWLAAEAG